MQPVFPAIWLSTRGVWVLLGVALIIAFASVVPVLVPVAVVAGAAYLALLAADVALGPRASRVRLTRRPAGFISLRHPATLRYVIENHGTIGIRIGILESPIETFTFARDTVESEVDPRTFFEVESKFEPRERGLVQLGSVYCWIENQLGMLRRRYRVEAPEDVRVFPDLSAIEHYGKLARRSTLLNLGLRKLRLRGAGAEFESLREYLPGDAFRSVNWKATARRGRMMVEQYEVERSQNVLVLLDAGRLMMPRIGLQRKFDYALTAGLSVASIAQAAGDHVGLTAFAAQPLLSIAPRPGAKHLDAQTRASKQQQPPLEETD
jgi:uncharacterized protein (DUF58 family)